MTWWRKLFAAIFPQIKRKYNRAIGWWYKRWLKKESHRIAEIDRDPDTKAFLMARRRARKEYRKEKEKAE